MFNAKLVALILRRLHSTLAPTAQRYNVTRGPYARLNDQDVSFFEGTLSSKNVLISAEDIEPFNVDWMKNYLGQSKIVLQPQSAEQVSAILRHCHSRSLAVCPQGGNTGLVGGSVPVHDEIILSMNKMNKILNFDSVSGTLSCEAGCVLQTLDEHASKTGFMMPIDLGAKGSCQIGGNLATSAGGVRLIRYGSLHASTMGMEIVLPDKDGTILDCMNTLRKDNTGYHLPHLFIGSEGSLGIITKAVLTCPSKPASINLAFLGCSSYNACLAVLRMAKQQLAEVLSSFEFLDNISVNVVRENLKYKIESVMDTKHSFYLLIEVAGSQQQHDMEKLETFLQKTMDKGLVENGVLAADLQQQQAMWRLRDTVSEACLHDGYVYKFDLSLPASDYYHIVKACSAKFGSQLIRVLGFGHLADGNLHLNATAKQFSPDLYTQLCKFVFQWTSEKGGSISAEHGIGFMKRTVMHYSKSQSAIDQMRMLKKLYDPKGILNPYKVIP